VAEKREQISWFEDLAGNDVFVGDRVAVAVSSRSYTGLRLGEVLEVTGIWDDRDCEWTHIRVKVQVEMTSDLAGLKYNRETKQWGRKPYIQTYDAADRIVKLS
jgi:hypothetical protein